MKVFAVSVVLLLGMLLGIAGNYIYINEVSSSLNTRLDALPNVGEAGCTEGVRDLLSYWERHAPTVGLSVAFPIVDRVSEQIAILLACAQCGDSYGFYTARALLQDAIGDLHRLEAFSVANLL